MTTHEAAATTTTETPAPAAVRDETLPPVPAGFYRCLACATDTPLGKPCVHCFPPIEEDAIQFKNGRPVSREDERLDAAASLADDRCPCCGRSITEGITTRAAVDIDKLQPGSLIMVTGKVLDDVMRVQCVGERSIDGEIWNARERRWITDRHVWRENVTGRPPASILQALMRDGAMGRAKAPLSTAVKGGA